ncbi:MAG: hypothetical protein ABIX46_08000 [Burkholderiaceae bacterium]
MTDGLKLRAKLLAQRFWQPTSACMTCMPGSLANLADLPHWALALQTGLATGALVLLLTLTPARRLFVNRYSNAAVVALLTVAGDAWSHPNHYAIEWAEAIVTGAVAGLLALVASFLLEDRARRLRWLWRRRPG